MAEGRKHGIVTFKADASLVRAMRGIPNRSDFIRSAILAALDSACPLCAGTGTLTPDQRRHWGRFRAEHEVTECENCHALHLVCAARGGPAECGSEVEA